MEAVAGPPKQKVLVELLTLCIERSKVREVVDPETIRMVIESSLADTFKNNEYHLDVVYKILGNEPGLTPQDAAVPILAFQTYEALLGISMVLPEALRGVPEAERMVLREAIGLTDAEVQTAVGRINDREAEARTGEEQKAILRQASLGEVTAVPGAPKAKSKRKTSNAVRIAGAALFLAAVGGVFVFSMVQTFGDTAEVYDTSDVDDLLKLGGAKRAGVSCSAKIIDTRWAAMPVADRKTVAKMIFDRERAKGVAFMSLATEDGKPAVMASEGGGQIMIQVF